MVVLKTSADLPYSLLPCFAVMVYVAEVIAKSVNYYIEMPLSLLFFLGFPTFCQFQSKMKIVSRSYPSLRVPVLILSYLSVD